MSVHGYRKKNNGRGRSARYSASFQRHCPVLCFGFCSLPHILSKNMTIQTIKNCKVQNINHVICWGVWRRHFNWLSFYVQTQIVGEPRSRELNGCPFILPSVHRFLCFLSSTCCDTVFTSYSRTAILWDRQCGFPHLNILLLSCAWCCLWYAWWALPESRVVW